jgi:hypothetical protein
MLTHSGVSNGDDDRHSVRSNVALIFNSDTGCQRYPAVNDLSNLMREHWSCLIAGSYWVARIHRIRLDWRQFLNRWQRPNSIL